MPDAPATVERPVVLFDGVCNLCDWAVNFIIDRDPRDRFRFTALQSERGTEILSKFGRAPVTGEPDSIVLIERGHLFERSTAALRIARHLRGIWKAMYVFIVVPRPLRDLVYRFIARNRYRWFGREEVCRVPTPELRARFLT